MILKLSQKIGFALWRKFMFITVFLICNVVANAQSQTVAQKNLIWYSEQCLEKHSGINVNSSIRIEVQAGTSVDLVIQEQTISFRIELISGSWLTEEQDGSLEYTIKYDNTMPGKMIISRSGGRTVISVDMTESSPDGINYDFFIDRVTNN